MSNLRSPLLFAIAAIATADGTGAAAAAPARCPAPGFLVHVTGFKAPTGTVRVQLYGGDPATWFDKGSYLKRVEAPAPRGEALDLCLPVPGPGDYAISVRHDLNGSGHADRSDGGGMSGNPRLSLFDLMLKRKPDPREVAVAAERGVRTVPITLNYMSGASFRPIAGRIALGGPVAG